MLSKVMSPQRKLSRHAGAQASLMFAEAGALHVEGLTKSFGSHMALHSVGLTLNEGEVVAVTGPSGAGKSTLGRLISGLEMPSAGRMTLAGRDFGALPPQARRVAHMFESYALFPTRTVAQNVASPLLSPTGMGRFDATQIRTRVDAILELAEMSALRDRLPGQLSGGQRQRVALCRALVQDPSMFVLDEPIGHLDAKLRHKLRGEIRRRQTRLRQPTVWLTPDGVEAMAVADRMVVLVGGTIQQVGTPDEVFARPANVRVARLIGDPAMNVLSVTLRRDVPSALMIDDAGPNAAANAADAAAQVVDSPALPIGPLLRARLDAAAPTGRVSLGLRPAELRVVPPGQAPSPGHEHWPATIYAVEPLGKSTIVTVRLGSQRLRVKAGPAESWPVGASVDLQVPADRVLCFDADTGLLQDG